MATTRPRPRWHAAEHHLYRALIGLAQGRASRAAKRTAATFERWAAQCPHNFEHKSRLLQGELARVRGRSQDAQAAFDAARVLEAAGDAAASDVAKARAADAYGRWGAVVLRESLTRSA